MKTIVVTNQKGGVGKTTTVEHLAHYLSKKGERVLVIDLDSQGSLTRCFLDDNVIKTTKQLSKSAFELITQINTTIGDVIFKTEHELIDIIPGNQKLIDANISLISNMLIPSQTRLKNKLNIETDYDYIIMDTSPKIDIVLINALICADQVLVPMKAEFESVEGISKIAEQISNLNINFDVKIKTNYFLNFNKNNSNSHKDFYESMTNNISNFLKNKIDDKVAVNKAKLNGKNIIDLNDKSSKVIVNQFASVFEEVGL